MGREQKKGKAGNAKAFITRAKALKKLQLSLPEWRRLCIIKGVYPRDPKKKVEGADKTYYLRKDVDFLAHERLIDTIRAQNAHRRKIVKAKTKKQLHLLKALVLSTPQARLDHIIVERFPRFEDALRELDDPLCIVALFSMLPAKAKIGIAPARVANCKRLMNEFLNFVCETHSLRRVFVSVKGYYYQAEIDGELITWIVPHRFTQQLPTDVDYSVMLTFLELYECMMNFVNYRLYTRQNLAYPPRIDAAADACGLELGAVRTESVAKEGTAKNPVGAKSLSQAVISAALARANADADEEVESDRDASDDGDEHQEEEEEEEEEEEDDDEMDVEGEGDGGDKERMGAKEAMGAKETKDASEADAAEGRTVGGRADDDEDDRDDVVERELLFGGKVIVLGRETPVLELEFVLKAFGAEKIIRQDALESGKRDALAGVTHWIIDRPTVAGTRVMTIEYVQPQFVFDSVNAGVLLPPALYAPGAKLPPHLSPFVADEDDGGYRPWFKDVVERIKSGDTSVVAEAAVTAYRKAAAPINGTKPVRGKGATGGAGASATGSTHKADADVGVDGTGDSEKVANVVHPVEDESENGSNEDEGTDEEEAEDESSAEENAEDADEQEKELRLVMMSRKKRRQYDYYAKEQQKKKERKATLTAKRNLLTQGEKGVESAKKKKRRTS